MKIKTNLVYNSTYPIKTMPSNFDFKKCSASTDNVVHTLYLHSLGLSQLPPHIEQFTQLRKLDLHNNKLSFLSPFHLAKLQELYLRSNNLTQLPNELSRLDQLQILDVSRNELTQLPLINSLLHLKELYLSHNKLTHLPDLSTLAHLRTLWLSYNKLTQLPVYLIYMQRLYHFHYDNNEITNLHPAITRWLNRNKFVQNIYTNGQSVHNHNIEHSVNESIKNFIKSHEYNKSEDIAKIIDDMEVEPNVNSLLKSYVGCDYIHSVLHLTFAEVLEPVLDYISKHPDKLELVKILADEIVASEDKCLQGRLSRLISVLAGYHPSVNINISQNEQIGNVVVMLKAKFKSMDIDEFVKIFRLELQERNYSIDIINEWAEYVMDNY
jgi:Leucine-rich repeat (LRR) protein